ncbi:MAG TPA: preprotein translocase subunit SecY [Lachnospiraceae bacterium]|nr:preprotein translocase subunit SecY [Lachnospiraceae bacterium]
MFKTFVNALKVKEVRKRLFFTLAMLVVIRIGSTLPLPGVDIAKFQEWYANLSSKADGALDILDAFTGGSFSEMTLFALSITPYITSSIIIQLLTIAIPKFEEWNKDEDGRKKMAAITRYVTIALSIFESAALAINFKNNGWLQMGLNPVLSMVSIITALTAGSAFLMWIGERITDKGVGNGISIVLTINIISRMPQDLYTLYQRFVEVNGKEIPNVGAATVRGIIVVAVIALVVVLVVVLNDGIRKIPVQYAKKVQGNRMIGGNTSHIPLRVNTAGVMPIIFASSLMQFPVVICQLLGVKTGVGVGGKILKCMVSSNWFKTGDNFVYNLGLLAYILLVIFFAYFYTSITFNPLMISDNMKKSGGFVPGIRPGKPTTEYLNSVLNYIIFVGAVGLIIVALIPTFCTSRLGVTVSFGGTSLIIIVSVILETMQQIETMMLERNYKGFLNS